MRHFSAPASPWHKQCEQQYGTPLDELFLYVFSPVDAKSVGDAWLRILSSEGYDVVAYLKEEMALHTAQHQLTYTQFPKPVWCQLVFDLGPNPGVYWDWQIDPESSAYLAREEFKMISLFIGDVWDYNVPYRLWERNWPFDYAKGSYVDEPWTAQPREGISLPPKWKRYNRIANERIERRLAKKQKRSKSSRFRNLSVMPGSWID